MIEPMEIDVVEEKDENRNPIHETDCIGKMKENEKRKDETDQRHGNDRIERKKKRGK